MQLKSVATGSVVDALDAETCGPVLIPRLANEAESELGAAVIAAWERWAQAARLDEGAAEFVRKRSAAGIRRASDAQSCLNPVAVGSVSASVSILALPLIDCEPRLLPFVGWAVTGANPRPPARNHGAAASWLNPLLPRLLHERSSRSLLRRLGVCASRRFAAILLMGRAGIEPATLGLKVPCSTD